MGKGENFEQGELPRSWRTFVREHLMRRNDAASVINAQSLADNILLFAANISWGDIYCDRQQLISMLIKEATLTALKKSGRIILGQNLMHARG